MTEPCIIRKGFFDRWYIFHPKNMPDALTKRAWSGSRWVWCDPDGWPWMTQTCNFETEQEARDYCRVHGLKVEN